MNVGSAMRNRVRVAGSAALLLLVLAAFAPLCSALAQCAMPCCHHAPAAASLNPDTPCPVKNCTLVRSGDELATMTLSPVPSATPVVVVARVVEAPASFAHTIAAPLDDSSGTHRPLHLINSTFLI